MKNKLIYGSICILFIVTLIFSNSLIAQKYNNGLVQTLENPSIFANSETYYGIDGIQFHNNLSESVSFNGWSFCETTKNNANKEILLLLKSSQNKKNYIIKTNQYVRTDIKSYFSGTKQIVGDFHGFRTGFSPLGMQKGEYELWIVCKENEENYGMAKTSLVFEKTSSGFTQRKESEFISQRQSLKIDEASIDKVKNALDSVTLVEGKIIYKGWAFLEGINLDQTSTFIELQKQDGETLIYDTLLNDRVDVAEVYGSQYVNSGFKAVIPAEEIKNGIYEINIILQSQGQYYTSKSYRYEKIKDKMVKKG